MSEETTAAPAEGTTVPETEQSEATVDSTASQEVEQSTEQTDVDKSSESTDDKAKEAAESEEDKEKRKGPSAKERISQLTREKYEAKRRAEELEQRLNSLEEKFSESQPEIQKPKWADFDTEEAYERAMEDYASKKTQQEVENSRREQEKQERERKQQLERQQTAQQFVSDIQSQKSHYQDFDTVMNDPTFAEITQNYSPDIVSLIQGSDKNVALFYHLGTHLDDAEKIAALPPVQAAREIALIESRLGKPQPKTVTNAPDPVKSTTGSAANRKDFSDPKVRDQMTDEEWLEWRNKTKKVM